MLANNHELEDRLWTAADELRANSKLRPAEYYLPVLGLIFLKYADFRFEQIDKALKQERKQAASGRARPIRADDYRARGVLYVPDEARYGYLVSLPEGEDIARHVVDAMKAIEEGNRSLNDVLPKTYNRLSDDTLVALLKLFNSIEMDMEGDVFGRIYEYFLAQFAMSEGRRGGEFFTPVSIVRLIVEIIEPYTGRILDPACGSGGMFVQSARFIEEHQGDPDAELSIYGQERVSQTARLCQMNLAVHGLEGDIRQGNTYYEDIHNSVGKFDFVMANPPFNVNRVDKERIEDDPRFPLGVPNVDNANYLWIQIFYSALNANGRAGFVMANSAADARHSEQAIREKLIQEDAVDVMVSIGSNFFYTVTLPCTLWFLDKSKDAPPGRLDNRAVPSREGKVLFLDARNIFRQIDRAHRDFTPEQIDFLAGIVRLYRGEDLNGYQFDPENLNLTEPQIEMLEGAFSKQEYQDVPGLCKVVNCEEIETQGWSLNPGRYVGVTERNDDDFDFHNRLDDLSKRFKVLSKEARELEEVIINDVNFLLEHK
jgi:type I restriction enzyme M protein